MKKIYFIRHGESEGNAGAIILARTIIPALSSDSNDVGLKDFIALDLVHGYDIWCHYRSQEDEDIKLYMEKYNLKKIVATPESAGLYVTENKIEAVGPSDVVVFEDSSKKIFHPGQFLI